MIHIVDVDLASRGLIFPSTAVGMVVAQPYLYLTNTEPFVCRPNSKQAQLSAIEATLNISRKCSHGADKTHFTVFPECSIPGLNGIGLIDLTLATPDWPTGTVVIGGIDGLTSAEYQQLAQQPSTHVDTEHNNPTQVLHHEWINCCIVWVKFPDGMVERWVQPKIVPAWVEVDVNHQAMFKGQSVFVFKGQFDNGMTFNRFCALVCFDWIGRVGQQQVWQWVTAGLGQQATKLQSEISLTWVFVIQCNEQPSHTSFLTQVQNFFDQTIQPNVLRGNCCLVMANVAGNARPGSASKYGGSSILHSSQAQFLKPKCHPTYGNGGQRQRASNQLAQLKDALFRERGACVHSFIQRNPAAIAPGAAGKALALDRPFVYPIETTTDPRAPAAIVPASVKWLNDDLDQAKSLGTKYAHVALAGIANQSHENAVGQLRTIAAQNIEGAVGLACPSCRDKVADEWDSSESGAVAHVVHTMTILGAANANPSIHGAPTHASIFLGQRDLEIVAIQADSHETCAKHFADSPPISRRPIIVISLDEHNTEWSKRFQSILNTPSENTAGREEIRVTDPVGALHYVGFRSILDAFMNAQTPNDLNGSLNACFTV